MGIYKDDGTPLRYFVHGDDLIRLLKELAVLPLTGVKVEDWSDEGEYERDFV